MDFNASTAESILTAQFAGQSGPVAVPAGGTVFLTASQVGVPDDVRQYSSYYLKIYTVTPLNATGYNPSRVDLLWYGFNNTSNGTLVYQDFAEWWADSNAGAFVSINGPVMLQDAMHGPFLVVQYQNGAAADTVNINFVLEYTTRTIPGPYFRQQSGVDGIIASINNGVGAGQNVTCPLHYGRLWVRTTSTGGGTNFTFQLAGQSYVFELLVQGAGTTSRTELITPKRALLMGMSNTAYTLFMHALYDRS